MFAATFAAVAMADILLLGSVYAQKPETVNRGVVELETTGSAGVSVRIAEDLARLIDDGATRRLLPVVGKGSMQNLTDLRYLRGIDVALIQTDVLEYARDQRLFPGIEGAITYITKLYNEEFHLLVRPQIKTIADLTNRWVNVDLRGSGTAITAGRLFDELKLRVMPTNDSQDVALEKLRRGEIDALAMVAGKPAPFFTSLRAADGLHFLAIPFNQSGSSYLPSRLTADEYPALISQDAPIDTVAVGSVLVAADLRQLPERYRNVANFVDVFFTKFQSLLEPGNHSKWQEVTLAADLPGWRRHASAQQWLQRNTQVAGAQNLEIMKSMFDRFIDERRQSIGGVPMTQQDKDALFQQFQSWQKQSR